MILVMHDVVGKKKMLDTLWTTLTAISTKILTYKSSRNIKLYAHKNVMVVYKKACTYMKS